MLEMDTTELERMLEDTLIGRLSMADATGRPYTIPLPFCWTGGSLYLRLPLTGRKGRVLAENDRVCFEVDTFTENLDDYASVIIEGRLVAVSAVEEMQRVRDVNTQKYRRLRRGHRPGHGRVTPVDDLPLRKIDVERVSGRKKEPSAGARREDDVSPHSASTVNGS